MHRSGEEREDRIRPERIGPISSVAFYRTNCAALWFPLERFRFTGSLRGRCGTRQYLGNLAARVLAPRAEPNTLLRPGGLAAVPGESLIHVLPASVAAGLRDSGSVGRPRNALRQVNLAVENGIVFDGEAKGADIALEVTAGAQLHATAGNDVALHPAKNEHVFGGKIGGDIGAG